MPDLEPFLGDFDKCRGFLLWDLMVIQQRLIKFPFDQSNVYKMGSLQVKALAWAGAYNAHNPVLLPNLN